MKQKWVELKGEIENSTTVGDFDIPLPIVHRTISQKINKKI